MEDYKIKDLILGFLSNHPQDFYNTSQLKTEIPELSGVAFDDVKFCLDEKLEDECVKHPENEPHSYYKITTQGRRLDQGGGYTLKEENMRIKEAKDQKAEEKRQKREDLQDKKLKLEIKQLYRQRVVWIPMLILLLGNIVQLFVDFWK